MQVCRDVKSLSLLNIEGKWLSSMMTFQGMGIIFLMDILCAKIYFISAVICGLLDLAAVMNAGFSSQTFFRH